ncbi:hypothetical protein B0T10DRAFT_55820 [Thelonectria olida]|uniref:Uncharacterized protein n=1 Tax=Thelonectria olida TaxID=1576542 RepID=A0A9P8W366_9HYPO|nr:hypothetical protein B0T10DRAFT_55820 [Thelonectria olida]
MSDGIAPAIDKVGEPEPKAPEAQAGAPTMHTTAPATEAPKPEEKKPEEDKPEEKKAEAGGLAVPKKPKPVEVISVPQTPLNNQTPAGGSPRPELKIDEEPEEKPEEEAQVILGPGDEVANKGDESADAETNGASEDIDIKDAPVSETASESAKRKLDDEAAAVATANGDASKEEKKVSNGRAGKKARVEDVPAPTSAQPATNGKSGRTKKKVEPVVGRTARKTRSQGPVEV